jgi:WS/DGAT/MGAT family acyltransferase
MQGVLSQELESLTESLATPTAQQANFPTVAPTTRWNENCSPTTAGGRYAVNFSERLSALDASFLAVEDEGTHMHVAAVLLFEAGPLRRPDGGLDIECIREWIAARLHLVPRYRQKLASVPLAAQPVWVDDLNFNLQYHVRHTCLPPPADERLLKRLAGRIMSQKLDRGKPLWEVWAVEGLEGDRFALVTKAHHCMVDGISGIDLIATLLRPNPGANRLHAGFPGQPPAGRSFSPTRSVTAPARRSRFSTGLGTRCAIRWLRSSRRATPLQRSGRRSPPDCGRPRARPSTPCTSDRTAASTGSPSI